MDKKSELKMLCFMMKDAHCRQCSDTSADGCDKQ